MWLWLTVQKAFPGFIKYTDSISYKKTHLIGYYTMWSHQQFLVKGKAASSFPKYNTVILSCMYDDWNFIVINQKQTNKQVTMQSQDNILTFVHLYNINIAIHTATLFHLCCTFILSAVLCELCTDVTFHSTSVRPLVCLWKQWLKRVCDESELILSYYPCMSRTLKIILRTMHAATFWQNKCELFIWHAVYKHLERGQTSEK